MASTQYLDVYVDEEIVFCAGTIAEYENAWQYNHAVLDISEPLDIRVFVPRSAGDYCPNNAAGCSKLDGTVVSAVGSVHHELGHSSSCEWRSSSAPALAEGLAVSFEVTPLAAKEDPREFITTGDLGRDDYPAAGHFVRWLLEEHGLEPFREAYEHAPGGGGEEVLEVLAAAYDQPADELFDAYMASAPYMWVPHRQCADLELLEPQAPGTWEFHAIFDCDDPSTLGPYEREEDLSDLYRLYRTKMYQSFLIEIEAPGMYRFQRDGNQTGLEIERCVDQAALTEIEAEQLWHKDLLFAGLQGWTDVELRAGTYRVDVLREYAEPHPVSVHIAPKPE